MGTGTYRSINGEDILKFIKAQRIRWLGHVKRMEVGAMPRKMTEGRLFIGSRKGRPRLRWMNDDVADLKVMEIKQWMEKTKERESNGVWLLRRPRLTQRMDGYWDVRPCSLVDMTRYEMVYTAGSFEMSVHMYTITGHYVLQDNYRRT
jgi:hypothetical protein